jgi:ribonucleoside-diphosphate reductase alpha chain
MAEPGLLFWDRIIAESPADCYAAYGFRTISTNPCSELPLSLLDSCRLLLMNLIAYVKNAYTSEAYFDFAEFSYDAQVAQRLLDDIIDLEVECIDKIINKIKADPESEFVKARELHIWETIRTSCLNGRRTGLGITALGDTLAALGIPYGSDKSIEMSERIYEALKEASYQSSIGMASELGAFPVWNWDLEKDNPFIQRLSPHLIEYIKKYGRRNIANLTTAPAGSVSLLAWAGEDVYGTSSGIEPVFALDYFRFKKINPNDENIKVDFVDATGDKWQKFKVYHPGVEVWMAASGETDITKSPWYGCCAEDIDWNQRVKLQAAVQKHVDHAISSTINLPEDVTVEKVAEIYETAWRAGCKGITVYRKNCRDGVLVDDDKEEKSKDRRPKDLHCNVHHITVKGKEYFVLVGMLDNKPYEVFAGKNGFLNKKIKTGKIIKKKAYYKAEFEDDTELSPITAACDEHEETVTRLTSALLRSGADMHLVVDQLEKVGGDMHSFARSISRALKTYIPDGTKVEGEKCGECGQEAIVRESGCKTCKNCGWSKCL